MATESGDEGRSATPGEGYGGRDGDAVQQAMERGREANPGYNELGGAPYPSDMTMPDPRDGNFEGATDPTVNPDPSGTS